MHQCAVCARQDPIANQEILLQGEARIAWLEVARPIACHSMAQHEVLGTGRRPDRVRLDETESADSSTERRRPEQRAGHRVAAQLFFSNRQGAMISVRIGGLLSTTHRIVLRAHKPTSVLVAPVKSSAMDRGIATACSCHEVRTDYDHSYDCATNTRAIRSCACRRA